MYNWEYDLKKGNDVETLVVTDAVKQFYNNTSGKLNNSTKVFFILFHLFSSLLIFTSLLTHLLWKYVAVPEAD